MAKMTKLWVVATAAFAVGGEIIQPGKMIELDQRDAADLIRRGRAKLPVEAADPAADLAAKSIHELRELAHDAGIDTANLKKTQLLTRLSGSD